jgi:autotransporter-associated beta strand protein
MKPSHNLSLRSAALAAMFGLGGTHSTHAANFWWDGTTGNWGDLANWSTSLAGTTDPSAAPLATVSDTLTFNTTPGNAASSTLYLNGTRGAGGSTPIVATMTFNGTGTTTLLGGTSATAANNAIFVNSITLNAGAGPVTFGTTAALGKADIRMGTASVTNNSSSLLTIASGLQTRGSTGTTTITITGTGNTLVSGVVGGGLGATVALSKTGGGVLTLSGANTSGYSGGTSITGGTLTFLNTGSKSTSGSNNHVFSAGTTLGLGVATSGSFYTDADITSAFALNGVGTGNLSRISVTATTNVGIDTTAGNFDRGTITGAPTKGLAKLGTNTLTLSGTNTYTGVTTVRAGTLKVNSTGVINTASASGGTGIVIGNSTLDIDGGTVNFNGGTALAVGDDTTAGNLIVRSGSNLNLTGAIAIGQGSTGTGNTPVSTFTQLGGTTTIGTGSTLFLGNYRGTTMDIQGGTLTSSSSANIGVRGNSTLTISGTSTAVTFTTITMGNTSGTTTATSDVNLNGGVLTLGASGFTTAATSGAKTVSFDGGTLKASAASTDFVNATSVYVKAGGATIDTAEFDVTIDNALLQFGATTGALTKTGTGTLALTGTGNSYTGATTIKAGTLKVNTSTTISTSSTIVVGDTGSSGAVLDATTAGLTVGSDQTLAGIGKVLATGRTLTASGTISPGDGGIGTLVIDGGSLALDSTSKFAFTLGSTGSSDLVSLLNGVALSGNNSLDFADFIFTTSTGFGGGVYTLIDNAGSITDLLNSSGLSGTIGGLNATLSTSTLDGNDLILTVIPEPAAAFLGSFGILALLRRRR